MDLIDAHTHVVCREFPDARPSESRWPCMCQGDGDRATVMIGGKRFREVDARSWDIGRRLANMDDAGVARQVLSPMPELLSYWFAPQAGLDMCRWLNDTIARMVSSCPGRFSGLGAVPLQDPELAARELGRLRQDGLRGVEIGSNVNGRVLGEAEFEPFYAEAERLDMAVFVHALHPIGADRVASMPDLAPFAAFPLDTALAAASLVRGGVPERYPALRFGFSHGGGAIVPVIHRLGKGAAVTRGFKGVISQPPLYYARRFFYDNLVYDPGYAAYLANVFAPEQVFCGTDYPYAIMEAEPADFLQAAAFEDPQSVGHGAAERFLGLGDRTEEPTQ